MSMMRMSPETEAAMSIMSAYYNAQVELLQAVAPAIESMAIAVKRAEVRVKMKHKRPRLRKSTRITQPMRRYVRQNPDLKWLLP